MKKHGIHIRASISTKLVGIIALLIVLSLLGMILVASYFFSEDIELRIIENNHSHTRVIARTVSTDFQSAIKIARLVSSALTTDAQTRYARMHRLEEQVFTQDRELICIARAEKDGADLRITDSLLNTQFAQEYSFSRSKIHAALRTSGSQFESSFSMNTVVINISPQLHHPMIAIGVPYVQDNGQQTDSIIIICMSMLNYVDTFRTDGIIDTVIVNSEGRVLASNNIDAILANTDLTSLPVVDMMLKSPIDNGQGRYTADGTEYLASFQKISFGDIGIIARVEADTAFRSIRMTLYRNILILVIVLTIAVIIGYFFSKSITNPVMKLVHVMKKVEKGDFSYQIQKIPNDEMGILMNSFNMMNRGLAEREKIKSAFGKFVNKDIAERALREDVTLGGRRTEVTVFFSDIRSFTALSETMVPEEVVSFLNEYLTAMVGCINKTNGVVDKFIGDAIMAVWGTPLAHKTDTENAVQCALLMRQALVGINTNRRKKSQPPVSIGCGINTGTVLAGQIGSQDRMEYTVIGDAVNLASRVESLNKPFGTDILITDETYRKVKEVFAVEKMRPIMIKGKTQKVQIWAVLGRLDDPNHPKSVAELQTRYTLKPDSTASFDSDGHEKKYKNVAGNKLVSKKKKT